MFPLFKKGKILKKELCVLKIQREASLKKMSGCPSFEISFFQKSDVIWSPGARFSKVPIINGPGKLSPFTLKTEVSIVLHLTRQNCQLMKQNGVVC